MLSAKLIDLIEGHWDSITSRVLAEIRQDARVAHIASLPTSDLQDRARDIVQRLGHWLSETQSEELARQFQRVGRMRREEDIPLEETVLCYQIIKNRMLEFVRDQGLASTPVAIYAEEELEHSVDRFFDHAIYNVIVGYQQAAGERQVRRAMGVVR